MIGHNTPCSCEGNNPDCYRCYGSGMEPRRSKKRIANSKEFKLPGYNLKAGIVAFKKQTLVKCKFCNSDVLEKNLEKHVRKLHSGILKVFQTRHTNIKLAITNVRNIKTLPARSSSASSIRCPNCAQLMLKTQLMEHLLSVHKSSNEVVITLPMMQMAFSSKTKYSAKPSIRNSEQLEGISKKQDATYGYHVIRESGSFGSHPSHDGFDDDSGA